MSSFLTKSITTIVLVISLVLNIILGLYLYLQNNKPSADVITSYGNAKFSFIDMKVTPTIVKPNDEMTVRFTIKSATKISAATLFYYRFWDINNSENKGCGNQYIECKDIGATASAQLVSSKNDYYNFKTTILLGGKSGDNLYLIPMINGKPVYSYPTTITLQ